MGHSENVSFEIRRGVGAGDIQVCKGQGMVQYRFVRSGIKLVRINIISLSDEKIHINILLGEQL